MSGIGSPLAIRSQPGGSGSMSLCAACERSRSLMTWRVPTRHRTTHLLDIGATTGLTGVAGRQPSLALAGIPESSEPASTDALVEARQIALRVFWWARTTERRALLLKPGMVMAALAATVEAYEQAGFPGAVLPLLWVLLYVLDLANSARP